MWRRRGGVSMRKGLYFRIVTEHFTTSGRKHVLEAGTSMNHKEDNLNPNLRSTPVKL